MIRGQGESLVDRHGRRRNNRANATDCSGFIPDEGGPADSSTAKKKKGSAGQLQDFYDLHCRHKYNVTIPGIGSIDVACNKMTTEFSGLPGLGAKWTDNLDTNQLISGTVMIGASSGLGSGELGPVKVEVKAGGGVFLEFDSTGITDAGPYGEIKAEIGGSYGEGRDPFDIKIRDGGTISTGDLPSLAGAEAGLEVRYGWNSGFSGKGGGILKGLTF